VPVTASLGLDYSEAYNLAYNVPPRSCAAPDVLDPGLRNEHCHRVRPRVSPGAGPNAWTNPELLLA